MKYLIYYNKAKPYLWSYETFYGDKEVIGLKEMIKYVEVNENL